MTTKNKLKISVSPIIYNNGNRNITLKVNDKEVYFMQDDLFIKRDFKELLLSDETIREYFLITFLHNLYKSENPKEHEQYFLDEYKAYKDILKDNKELHKSLSDFYNEAICNDIIDDVTEDYLDLSNNEGKGVLYTLSRLLYLQDKYKDEEIGDKIDTKIKEWLKLIKNYDDKEIQKEVERQKREKPTLLEIGTLNQKMSAYILYNIVPSINYDIANINKHDKFMKLQEQYDIPSDEMRAFLINYLNNKLNDAKTNSDYAIKINNFIYGLETNKNSANFERDKAKEIQVIKDKYGIKNNKDGTITIPTDKQEAFFDEYTQLYGKYLDIKDNVFNIQDNNDVKKWRDKADKFIKHLMDYDKEGISLYGLFTMDYTLKHLAYNDYQKEAYKLNLDDEIKDVTDEVKGKLNQEQTEKKPKLNAKELKEKYQDITQLNGEILNANKKWALLDTNKANNNIMNIREIIGKKVDSNTEITQRKINKLKSKTRPTKQDLDDIKELEELKKEQEQEQQVIISECEDLQADINLLNKQISSEQDGNEVKKLARRRNKIEKLLREKRQQLNSEGVYFQMNLEGKLTYEKVNAKTKESYKLMINADYDVQNFNQEGRNFLQYIPNIDNVVNQLNEDYITIDLDNYVDFNGISNPRRTRQRLLKTLTEMRKESYEYSYIDEKGALQEGSLVLIGDVMTTEYKGKNTLKVQLGGQFKRNIQQAIIKGQIAHVNKEVFKLGHGKNNKKEYMAKELYLYFVRLARTEAKKGLIKGVYEKALKISTIIDYLTEINLLNYNPYRYNESVKEPLQLALYTGQELGLYDIKTDAFKYYDDVISTLNKGANVKDKVTNFENQLIKITLYNDNTDLESNQKAHETYKANKKKYGKRATKK